MLLASLTKLGWIFTLFTHIFLFLTMEYRLVTLQFIMQDEF